MKPDLDYALRGICGIPVTHYDSTGEIAPGKPDAQRATMNDFLTKNDLI